MCPKCSKPWVKTSTSGICNRCRYQSTKARRKRIHQFLRDYKAERGCSRCPESDPACLDFHHTDPSRKTIVFSKAKDYSMTRYREELEHCVVLCANCHRKEHNVPPHDD